MTRTIPEQQREERNIKIILVGEGSDNRIFLNQLGAGMEKNTAGIAVHQLKMKDGSGQSIEVVEYSLEKGKKELDSPRKDHFQGRLVDADAVIYLGRDEPKQKLGAFSVEKNDKEIFIPNLTGMNANDIIGRHFCKESFASADEDFRGAVEQDRENRRTKQPNPPSQAAQAFAGICKVLGIGQASRHPSPTETKGDQELKTTGQQKQPKP